MDLRQAGAGHESGLTKCEICLILIDTFRNWNVTAVRELSSWDSTNSSVKENLIFTANDDQSKDGLLEILVNEIVQGWADGKLKGSSLLLTRRGQGCDFAFDAHESLDEVKSLRLVVESIPRISQ